MLLSKDEVIRAMNLDVAAVRAALNESGFWDTSDISDVEFLGMNMMGQFTYRITYPAPDDEGDATGNVYLKFARKAFCKVHHLTGEF